ncbi:MAG: hypothetical protein BGO01_03000 [Armatimonadetes bacterium 55-13]|nr:hypothetical protein [Armatimonadota bacterium]OJU63627.1 MAG: hypothetical protein BGO01_03000 [Armatimonadetes bacterium 55-13]
MLHAVVREKLTSGEADPLTLILLHGLGADEFDLLGLVDTFDHPMRVVSLRAPLSCPWGGYSWFGIDVTDGQLAVDGEEVLGSYQLLLEFLSSFDSSRVILGGFSQGAMMTLGVMAANPGLVKAGLAMSGGLLPIFDISEAAAGPILMTHGSDDPIVPVSFGRESAALLTSRHRSVEFREYRMGHEIAWPCLSDISMWFRSLDV